jgi:hypothetical protein
MTSGRQQQIDRKILESNDNEIRSFITLYVDNFSHQNKNWLLCSNLLMIINDSTISFEEITFVYLERGHTFLSADRVHANTENIVRKCLYFHRIC